MGVIHPKNGVIRPQPLLGSAENYGIKGIEGAIGDLIPKPLIVFMMRRHFYGIDPDAHAIGRKSVR
jgi:hypothetical protein